MNLRIDKKELIILVASAIVIAAIYALAYFFYIAPIKSSLSIKENQLKMEQQLNEALETKLASAEASDFSSAGELQKKLPVDPLVEQMVLDLEKAEVISNSFISSVEFNFGEHATIADQYADTSDGQQSEISESGEPETQIDTEESGPSAQQTELMIPEGLANFTASIIVRADDYFGLEKFIQTLESLQRIVAVNSISFTGADEIFTLTDEEDQIEMTLTIHAFYLPMLKDLQEFNPKIETPTPANKRNPFPTFGDYFDDNVSEEDEDGQNDGN
ncbi:hypothetical protein [Mesobacillus subterraneus]|uniref:Pilus assembly protein PilO n=1 Tax=Mesobacillus subterraneus TaxID=285983 RepID=A0A427THY3_9BACI|nr:hypothetical protein [Mesobacillus subterraneus]RSD23312.1 hypothetical protein EJA10_20285 [Mesobacillus subterraneus]